MRYLAVIMALLMASNAWGGACTYCDPNDPVVPGQVTRFKITGISPVLCCQDSNLGHVRVCGDDFIDPLPGVPVRHRKCSGGAGTPGDPYTTVVEMSQAEKDARDAADAPDPNPQLTLIQTPDGTVQGGMAARAAGEVWFGSETSHPLFLLVGLNKVVAIGNQSGAKMGVGVTDAADFIGDDTLVVAGVIRLLSSGVSACDASHEGTLRFVPGAAGVDSTMEACLKNQLDNYVWTEVARP